MKRIFGQLLTISMALLISSCFSAVPTPSPESVQTAAVELLTENAPTKTLAPTTTNTPTPTPTLSPTPSYQAFTAQEALDAFVEAGLDVADAYLMEPSDYGLAPLVAIEGIRFFMPTLCGDCSARVFSYENPEDLALHKQYFVGLGESSAAFFSWTFDHHNLLLQMANDISRENSSQYEAALKSLSP